jgi:FkbM family methyltransferase
MDERKPSLLMEKHFADAAAFGRFAEHFLQESRKPRPLPRDDLAGFLLFAARMTRKAKGQLFQDLWALWETDRRREGFFVEFGAASGVNLSNTWLLEKEYGWTGILAEPNPAFHASLREARTCQIVTDCVYSRTGETLRFLNARMGEVSRLADIVPDDMHELGGSRSQTETEEMMVRTISLNDMLAACNAPQRIDFMSVDTEGSELEILAAFDFDRWDVRAICVEHNFTATRDSLYALLTAHGYRRKWPEFTRFDDWYVRDPA